VTICTEQTLFQQRQSISEGKSDRSTREDRKAGLQEQKMHYKSPGNPNYSDKSRISSADCQAANFGWNETRSACALIICIQNALRLMHGNARNAS